MRGVVNYLIQVRDVTSTLIFLFQSELNPNRESSPMGLRTAFSTANKALSWRGDHPMKNEHFFKANELSQEEKGQGRTYTTRLAQKQGARNAAGTPH